MPQYELDINLIELEIINRWLGGYSVSFSGLLNLNMPKDKEISILDIGCGGGDGMISMQQFLKKRLSDDVRLRHERVDVLFLQLLHRVRLRLHL